MAEGQAANGRNWPVALGTILTCIIGSFTVIQVVMAPLEERLVALDNRVNEAVRGANVRLDEVAARTEQWRADYAASVRQAIADASTQAEERRVRTADRQSELNVGFATTIGEVAARFNRLTEERARLLGEFGATQQQMKDHVALIDARLRELEELLERLPDLNCTPNGNCTSPFGPR
jgi:chromosome segregation ATPase